MIHLSQVTITVQNIWSNVFDSLSQRQSLFSDSFSSLNPLKRQEIQRPWAFLPPGTVHNVYGIISSLQNASQTLSMQRSDTMFCNLARHEKDVLIDSLTFINQRRSLRLSITWSPLLCSLLRSRFLRCHATLPPKKRLVATACCSQRTTFLSWNKPIMASVTFSRTFSRQIRPLKLAQSENAFYLCIPRHNPAFYSLSLRSAE